jgi:addiction module HigA family antidote
MMTPANRRPITPGKVIREDFLVPLGMSQGALADALGVSRSSLARVLGEDAAVSPEMAVRLGHALGTSPGYWLNLQTAVTLYDAMHSSFAMEVKALPVLVGSKKGSAA